jgi:hypothetical protein
LFRNNPLRIFAGMDTQYITVAQLAAHLGISVRAAHWHLKQGKEIPGVASYGKLKDNRTAPYLITPDASYFKAKRKTKK